jgi:hypothetical protein
MVDVDFGGIVGQQHRGPERLHALLDFLDDREQRKRVELAAKAAAEANAFDAEHPQRIFSAGLAPLRLHREFGRAVVADGKAGRNALAQEQHLDCRSGFDSFGERTAAGEDFVVGVRRDDQ